MAKAIKILKSSNYDLEEAFFVLAIKGPEYISTLYQ